MLVEYFLVKLLKMLGFINELYEVLFGNKGLLV